MRQLLRLFFLLPTLALAQPPEKMVKVVVAPDHADWTYKTGEPSRFTISVLRNGVPVKGATVRYELGPEKMEAAKKGTLTLANGSASLDGGTMKSPGFLRLTAVYELDGKEYRNLATTAYDPLALPPAAEDPADFEAFWNGAKADLAKIPMDARMTLLPERCTENVNVYHLSLQNIGNSRFYGILCVPKKEGKYPALLRVPGAGVRAYNGDVGTAEKGVITLEVGIHGVPVTMEPYVYTNLAAGPLAGYWNSNLDDKDKYYYKRVYLGCVRANDFLMGLPQFDGSTLGVTGGSQGGALSIITAALDSRVKFLGAFYPALSDLTGYLKGRAGGWPHLFAPGNLAFNNKPDKIKTSQYYDVVNFARRVKVPGYYSWGFNDETCPPTSMYAAYNVITAPKTLYLAQETGHWTYPEQTERVSNWLLEQMGGGTLTKK